jgi:hypothetical protein
LNRLQVVIEGQLMKNSMVLGALRASVLLATALAAASNTSFAALTYTGSGTGGRAASVTFSESGGDLIVTLSNMGTEPTSQWDASYLLGAVFFNYTGLGTLAANSTSSGAVLPGGNGIIGSLASGATIGSYWAYAPVTGGPASQVLTGVGYNLGGLPANGNMGPDAQKVDGANGSLLGWNNVNNANGSVTMHEPLAYTTIVFTLDGSGLPSSLVASDFTDVTFQYGTMLSGEASIGGGVVASGSVPEPNYGIATAVCLLPVIGLALLRTRHCEAQPHLTPPPRLIDPKSACNKSNSPE